MKKWSMFLAAAACACVLASPLQAAELKKVNISFPTAATTGALYPLGAGIANLWNTKLGYVTRGCRLQRRHSEPQPAQSRERAGFIRRVEHYL